MSTAVKETPSISIQSIRDLRSVLDWLLSEGELIAAEREVNPYLGLFSFQEAPPRKGRTVLR